MIKTYSIPKFKMESFEKTIRKMNNKARRLGLEPLEFEIVGSETKEYDITRIVERKIAIEFIQVTVQGEAPQIEGYNLVAMIERVGENNIVKRFDSGIQSKITTQELASIDMSCNHCESNRRRKYVFVLENEEGKIIQVGKACLKDFTNGNLSADSIASYYDELDVLDELQRVDEDEGFFSNYGNQIQYKVEDLVGFSIFLTDTEGYASTTSFGQSTKDKTMELLRTVSSDDKNLYKDYFSKVDEVLNYFKNAEASNDYMHNLKILLSEKYVEYKHIGYVVSAYNSMIRAKGRETEKIKTKQFEYKSRKESQYVGNVGEKAEFELEYNRSLAFSNDYSYYGGVTYMHFFYDNNDNVFVWSTSKELNLEQGEKITLVGTIKQHKEYRDTKQTVITRCKIK